MVCIELSGSFFEYISSQNKIGVVHVFLFPPFQRRDEMLTVIGLFSHLDHRILMDRTSKAFTVIREINFLNSRWKPPALFDLDRKSVV